MRRFAASATAKATVSIHSWVLNLTGPGGMPTPTSKIVAPPMPTAAMASRSATIPSRVTLPFIQCHQTCGRAAGGGERKAERSWSSPAAPATAAANAAIIENTIRFMADDLLLYLRRRGADSLTTTNSGCAAGMPANEPWRWPISSLPPRLTILVSA